MLVILSSYATQEGDVINGNGLYCHRSFSSMWYLPSRYLSLPITKDIIAHQNALTSVGTVEEII